MGGEIPRLLKLMDWIQIFKSFHHPSLKVLLHPFLFSSFHRFLKFYIISSQSFSSFIQSHSTQFIYSSLSFNSSSPSLKPSSTLNTSSSLSNLEIGLPRPSSWIAVDPQSHSFNLKLHQPFNSSQSTLSNLNQIHLKASHQTSLDLHQPDLQTLESNQLPPSPIKTRLNLSNLARTQDLILENLSIDDHQTRNLNHEDSVSPRSTWMKRRPRRLNKLLHSISLPELPIRHPSSTDPSLIIDQVHLLQPNHHQAIHFNLNSSSCFAWMVLGLISWVKILDQSLKLLIRMLKMIYEFISSLQLSLDSMNGFLQDLRLTLELIHQKLLSSIWLQSLSLSL